jgi:hypothetical protein
MKLSTNYRHSITLFHKPRTFGEIAIHQCFKIEGCTESGFTVYLKLNKTKALILTDGYGWTKDFDQDETVFSVRYGLIET